MSYTWSRNSRGGDLAYEGGTLSPKNRDPKTSTGGRARPRPVIRSDCPPRSRDEDPSELDELGLTPADACLSPTLQDNQCNPTVLGGLVQ